MNEAIVTLKKGEGRTIKAGGAWIFDNEIDSVMGSFENGDIVVVHDFDGYMMGRGFINTNSKIRVRMMTRKKDQIIDDEFIKMRVQNAWDYRKNVLLEKDLNCCRVIFGEADFLPGLVIDKYDDVLVVESLALGIDKFKLQIVDYLKEAMAADGYSVRGVYERSDAAVRKKEGLAPYKGFIGDEFDTNVEIVENGVHYMVDVVNGQKTGFFLDQKYNRLAIQRLCKGKKVLDCFTHMGTFALNAGIAGAADVTGLDISEFAVSQATANAKLNGLDSTVKFRQANVLDELPKLAEAGEKYDVVILDPPAFTKSREATKNAMKGYREINMKGLKLVKDGGYLATCSCSHFMTQELFVKVIGQAAQAAHKRLRQVEFRTQAPDHPILWAADESYYLKFLVFQVVDEK
ncbi:class I SAM-dependent rRNA methyltransferase [Pseudobutyrivibrio ruminis]|uniref:23S rRNA (Cytosine1962-C5)-methyltransferase n=1 Tax=Pseudobutyrivibrio ruminis DSM 9787 TaxID=1123011 RepID=A0A285ST30_9FIRM|nr:class I SAM-dependent rRNA methyltransferase [Pseudobutyrivibrio ruminis]SOC11676.1 23S rRNA (cytosine1962-C5)-methyltransferase [Pseudobutyrivibrio ruminis DSM 9787]